MLDPLASATSVFDDVLRQQTMDINTTLARDGGMLHSSGMQGGPLPEPGEAPPPQDMYSEPYPSQPSPPGDRTLFATGAQRDTQEGKPNFYECMSPLAYWRYGEYMNKASAKYGPDNWTKGIPVESYINSLERHLVKLKAKLKYGIDMEPGVDHAAAIMFNIMGLMHVQVVTERNADDDDDLDY